MNQCNNIYMGVKIFLTNQRRGCLEKICCVCYDRGTKKENHRRAATSSQENGITAYRVKVGRLFLFYGNNVASDENND